MTGDGCQMCGAADGDPCGCFDPQADDTASELTVAELRKAEARYQRAVRRSEEAREARNAAVRAALEEGWTHARIAEETGLTRGRIGQLAQGQTNA